MAQFRRAWYFADDGYFFLNKVYDKGSFYDVSSMIQSHAPTVVFWLRQDLRLADNPALLHAAEHGQVVPVYILDDISAGDYRMGAASRVWLHTALQSLQKACNHTLLYLKGNAEILLPELVNQLGAEAVYWNRCYEPWRMQRDARIKKQLMNQGVHVQSDNASLLWEPWQIKKDDGTPFKVFTPFYRKGCLKHSQPRLPLPAPELDVFLTSSYKALSLDDLDLYPSRAWGQAVIQSWRVSEQGAMDRLDAFIENGLRHYKDGRNLPAKPYVSRLSPYLHIGLISPQQIWHAISRSEPDRNTDHFCSELGWREFSYYLLYHNPSLPEKNLQSKFDAFAWQRNAAWLRAWQKGATGVPMVDAGMRELWQTGFMHNRVRMIVASFLVKNLRIDWREGEKWFWDTLFDADLASNSASWQWVAGCGADAAPYFRIFNPVTQGQKFDPDGQYVRQYVPELAKLPTKWLFAPWEAPQSVLAEAGVHLGVSYPHPIVSLKDSREKALEAFQALKSGVKKGD